jgi:type II secretory pathway component PulM
MLFRTKKPNAAAATSATSHSAEPEAGRPTETGEEWLGRNRSAKRRLWERLNPRHRKELLMIAEALAMQQTHANLPEPLRARLSESIEQVERLARRMAALLAEVTRRTPPRP